MTEAIDTGEILEALNDKIDRDCQNVDTASGADCVIAYQIPTSSNNYTWYRKYKSGWIEQGGLTRNSVSTYTLPVTMSDTNYCVYGTWDSGKSSNFYPSDWSCHPLSTTQIYINSKDNTNVKSYCWKVEGMAA